MGAVIRTDGAAPATNQLFQPGPFAAFAGPGTPAVTPEGLIERKVASDNLFEGLSDAAGALSFIQAKQAARRDERKVKAGHSKTMSRANSRIQKTHRDMIRAIRDVRMATLGGRTTPTFVKASIHRMVLTTTGYTSMLRPQLDLMGEMHRSNLRIREAEDAESSYVGMALNRTGAGRDRAQVESARYMSASGVRFDMEEGKFEMSSSRGVMRDALSLVEEACESLRGAIESMKRRLTPKEEGYHRKQIARMDGKFGVPKDAVEKVPEPESAENQKNARLDSELVALDTMEKERLVLAASFREVMGMESYVA